MMIAALFAASLAHSAPLPTKISVAATAPCQAVPALCIVSRQDNGRLLPEGAGAGPDNKMNAYRFDARPCRVIGNMGCPKQARLRLFRLGEPLRETLMNSFMPR
ncbi:hypothetical protein EP837_01847 [Sphingobium sp. EP60837]|jgi:hypothetical protein|nr:hypothetical protein EP837_01847 [Sphingobium sp. EP60837]